MADESKPKTVRVRVAVAVNGRGQWCANGNDDDSGNESAGYVAAEIGGPEIRIFWIEAELPVPVAVTLRAAPVVDDSPPIPAPTAIPAAGVEAAGRAGEPNQP